MKTKRLSGKIVELAQAEKDSAPWNFAQWFVKEQIEEETVVMELLGMLKVAGEGGIRGESVASTPVGLFLAHRFGIRPLSD